MLACRLLACCAAEAAAASRCACSGPTLIRIPAVSTSQEGIRPNLIAYSALITACVKDGRWYKAMQVCAPSTLIGGQSFYGTNGNAP